jgi:hypothetical protein
MLVRIDHAADIVEFTQVALKLLNLMFKNSSTTIPQLDKYSAPIRSLNPPPQPY